MAAVLAAGASGLGPQAVADAVGRNVKTVRNAFKDVVADGELVYRDHGPRSVYAAPDPSAGPEPTPAPAHGRLRG